MPLEKKFLVLILEKLFKRIKGFNTTTGTYCKNVQSQIVPVTEKHTKELTKKYTVKISLYEEENNMAAC